MFARPFLVWLLYVYLIKVLKPCILLFRSSQNRKMSKQTRYYPILSRCVYQRTFFYQLYRLLFHFSVLQLRYVCVYVFMCVLCVASANIIRIMHDE